jgi:arylsulfatase A
MLRYLSLLLLLNTWAHASQQQPNVLLIITDDQGYGDLSCHGNPVLKTPVLDKLASESIQMERFFVSPLCAPTRSSLLTGRYSLRTGVSGVSDNKETMRSEEVTLAEVLKTAGYHTGIFGKWHNGDNTPNNPQSQGFDTVWGYNRGHWNNYFDTTVKKNGKPVKAPGFIVDATTDEAISFMDSHARQPFLAYVSYTTPHSPFQCPDKEFQTYKAQGLDDRLACIYGMCANLDNNIGRLLQHLDNKQLTQDTIVIFLTDNGPNGQRYNGGMKGIKGSPDEGGSRVPFFLRWPARFKQPVKIPHIAMHCDVLPTLTELCGIKEPRTLPWDGRSLVPLMDGTADAWPQRTLFTQWLLEGKKAGAAVRTQQHRAVRTGSKWSLYDMQADPGQLVDLATSQAPLLESLVKQYEVWQEEMTAAAAQPRDLPQLGGSENPVELSTPNAEVQGSANFPPGKAHNNCWLADWTGTDAKVCWKVQVQTAGTYRIRLNYLCPQEFAGATMQMSARDHKTSATVTATPLVQLPSPDRSPRETEVHEMLWHQLDLGSLTLTPGPNQLQLSCTDNPKNQALWLKAIEVTKE